MSSWQHGSEQYRPADRDDLPAFVELLSDPEVCRWLWFTPITPAEVEAYFGPALDAQTEAIADGRDPDGIVVAVEDESGRFLGHGATVPVDGSPGGYEIGFQLVRSAWGRGVGTRLGEFLVAFAIERHDAHRIQASCLEGNAGSASILSRLGLLHEGTLVEHRERESVRHSELVFGARAPDLDQDRFRRVATRTGLSSPAEGSVDVDR